MQEGGELTVLVEGRAKRWSEARPQMTGRSDHNKRCVWTADAVKTGELVRLRVLKAASARTLLCEPV